MWILSLVWIVLAVACALAAARAWGRSVGMGVFVALVLGAWLLPFGKLLTAAAACGIGLRAEQRTSERLEG